MTVKAEWYAGCHLDVVACPSPGRWCLLRRGAQHACEGLDPGYPHAAATSLLGPLLFKLIKRKIQSAVPHPHISSIQ